METPWLSLDVYILQSGQPRPYADSIYDYKIVNKSATKFNESFVLEFCIKFLRPSKKESEREGWWESYYTFEKVDDRTFRYTVVEPYTD